MITIQTLKLGELETNCYLVIDQDRGRDRGQVIIIDPADSGDFISQTVLERGLTPSAIVLTHGHFDHVLGLLELKLNFPTAHVFMHPQDVPLLMGAQKSAQHWLKRQVDPVPKHDIDLTTQTKFKIGTVEISVLETPGHTPGGVCLYIPECDWQSEKNEAGEKQDSPGSPAVTQHHSGVLFTGDLLFKGAVGRTDFSYSSPPDLEKSINSLKVLPQNTVCFPGHGETTTLGAEVGQMNS